MKILLSLIIILGLAQSADDPWQGQQDQGYSQNPQPEEHLLKEVRVITYPQQSNWIPYAVAIVGTPILAYAGVKFGSSIWFQSTGVAHVLGTTLKTILEYYPHTPRNITALLVSWGACTTAALFYASDLRLTLSFGNPKELR